MYNLKNFKKSFKEHEAKICKDFTRRKIHEVINR